MNDEIQEVQEIPEGDWDDVGQGLDPSEEDLKVSEGLDLNNMAPVNIGGIYELFSGIIKNPDVTRICNLSKEEMGILPFTVRGSLYVAQLAERFGHKIFAAFFVNQAEIIEETSLSRDGFLINTIVTSKRYSNVTKDNPPTDFQEQIQNKDKKKKRGFNIFGK